MIVNESCFRKGTNCGFYKSLNDKKRYRFFRLENGLRVLLVQDEIKKSNDNAEQVDRNGVKKMRLDDNVEVSNENSVEAKTKGGKYLNDLETKIKQ